MRQVGIEHEKRELGKKIANLSERISVTTDQELLTIYDVQRKQLLHTQTSISSSTKPEYTQEELQTASNVVFQTLEEPIRMWQNPDFQMKTTIVRMYFPSNLPYNIEEGFQTVEIESIISLINSIEPTDSSLVEMPGVEPGCTKETRTDFY